MRLQVGIRRPSCPISRFVQTVGIAGVLVMSGSGEAPCSGEALAPGGARLEPRDSAWGIWYEAVLAGKPLILAPQMVIYRYMKFYLRINQIIPCCCAYRLE